jgi:uncharacterized protein with NRDE domain
MCLIFLSLQDHPHYKLIITANRDEFYQRKTAPATWWADQPQILGGRDLEAMGTWMGITRTGRISLLTNYRDPAHIDPHARSRGKLVSDYLSSDVHPLEYLQQVQRDAKLYNGFNLLVGHADGMWYYSNYGEKIIPLTKGFYGLSNHLLDTPWPKVVRGKEKLKPILAQHDITADQLLDIMYDESTAPDADLPNTGLTLDRERALSSMFIKTPNYGSRCSTAVFIDHDHHVSFTERIYDLSTFRFTSQTFQFNVLAS